MEKNPIKTLIKEHKTIDRVENVVYLMENMWLSDPQKYKEFVIKLIRFFKDYSDVYHHQKEETVVFPALDNHPEFFLHAVIHEIEAHHESFRESVKDLEEYIMKDEYEKSYSVLRLYVEDLLDHIAIENDEIFIMCESLFSASQLENMYFKFKDIDAELGEEIKTELENIPKEIEQYFVLKNEA